MDILAKPLRGYGFWQTCPRKAVGMAPGAQQMLQQAIEAEVQELAA